MSKFFEAKGAMRKNLLAHVEALKRKRATNVRWMKKKYRCQPVYYRYGACVVGGQDFAEGPDMAVWKKSRHFGVYVPRANHAGKKIIAELGKRTIPSHQALMNILELKRSPSHIIRYMPGWKISRHARPRLFIELPDSVKPTSEQLVRISDVEVEKAMKYKRSSKSED